MLTKREEFITLPSNVKTFGHENSISHYKTKLKKRYAFDQNEDWRVGLAEIIYTKTWNNIRELSRIRFLNADGHILENGIFDISHKNYTEANSPYFIQPGYYHRIEDLINVINRKLEFSVMSNSTTTDDLPQLSFDNVQNLVTIKCGYYYESGVDQNRKYYAPIFEPEVEKLLGLSDEVKIDLLQVKNKNTKAIVIGESWIWKIDPEKQKKSNEEKSALINEEMKRKLELDKLIEESEPKKPENSSGIVESEPVEEDPAETELFNSKNEKMVLSFKDTGYHVASKKADINAGFNSMFIYSNIVNHQSVGDAYAQLLRNVPLKNEARWGEAVHLSFDKPHLIPIHSRTFDTIEIDIKDDTGRRIPFKSGRVIIKLVLKKYD